MISRIPRTAAGFLSTMDRMGGLKPLLAHGRILEFHQLREQAPWRSRVSSVGRVGRVHSPTLYNVRIIPKVTVTTVPSYLPASSSSFLGRAIAVLRLSALMLFAPNSFLRTLMSSE